MAEIVDELQKIIDEKDPEECQELECHNKRYCIVTVVWGKGETNFDEHIVCQECKEKYKKEARDWAYGFTYQLLPGQIEEIKIKKRRGRPRNL